jgi:2-hydroxy-3-keto-5-methylthiopentenyl-1-phosphate phosphatase
MEPFIRAVLSTVIPDEDADHIHIIAYKAELIDPSDPKSRWQVVFRHPDLDHGHDKSKAILPYRDLPGDRVMFFCGDGVSDLPAAEHADVLFAKDLQHGEPELMDHCRDNGITHVPYKDLSVSSFLVNSDSALIFSVMMFWSVSSRSRKASHTGSF